MSDYLSNLVSRTLNPGSVIRPRRTSLFEPEAAAAGPKIQEIAEPGQLSRERETPTEKNQSNPSAISDHSPRDTKLIAETQPLTREHDHNQLDVRPDYNDRKIDVYPAPIQPDPITAQTHAFDREWQSSLLIPIEAPKVINQASENISIGPRDRDQQPDRSVAANETDAGWPKIEKNVRQLLEDRFAASQSSHPKDNSPAMVSERNASPTAVVAPTPQPVAIRPASVAVAPPTLAPDVAPTIKVTIGRIDVRAIAQSPQVSLPKVKRTVAPQSLDEYLKHRSGGRK